MSQACPDFETLCEFALDFLISRRGDARSLAAALVQRHPEVAVLELVLVLSSVASGLETTFSNPEARAMALDVWRMSALLAVDLQQMGTASPKAREMLKFWRAEDDFFLRAG